MGTRLIIAGLAGLLAAAVLPGTAAAAQPAAPINWTECGTTNKGQCATIPVPADWSRPGGARFDLAIT